MHSIPHVSIAAALVLSLAACGGAKTEQAAGTKESASGAGTVAVAADTSPAPFKICKSCHSVEKGKTVIGPSLFGITGTKAGEVAGYSFSPAMKASGLTWDDATLDAFLTSPMKSVPGTRMTYAGQSDPAKRAEIIAYLKTLK
jgi:cytochrome c